MPHHFLPMQKTFIVSLSLQNALNLFKILSQQIFWTKESKKCDEFCINRFYSFPLPKKNHDIIIFVGKQHSIVSIQWHVETAWMLIVGGVLKLHSKVIWNDVIYFMLFFFFASFSYRHDNKLFWWNQNEFILSQ